MTNGREYYPESVSERRTWWWPFALAAAPFLMGAVSCRL